MEKKGFYSCILNFSVSGCKYGANNIYYRHTQFVLLTVLATHNDGDVNLINYKENVEKVSKV